MTMELWISGGAIILQLGIAIVGYIKTKKQVSDNDKQNRLSSLSSKLDSLRTKSCEYWGKTSMTPEYQQLLECEIKSTFEDIKLNLSGLYTKFKKLRESIYALQTGIYVEINTLITNGNFETRARSLDKDKCDAIIAKISEFKKEIERLTK